MYDKVVFKFLFRDFYLKLLKNDQIVVVGKTTRRNMRKNHIKALKCEYTNVDDIK